MKKMTHIACVMMLKNEQERIRVSLESVKGYVKSVIIYDTGSTDDTIDIVKDYCKDNDMPLHLLQGEFIDFSVSRNTLLDFADTIPDIDYYLLLDCNDELKNGQELLSQLDEDTDAWLVKQFWECGNNYSNTLYNIRLLRSGSKWRYRGSVHEYLMNETNKPSGRIEHVTIYQDRRIGCESSRKRWSRDLELLIKDHLADPEDGRPIYYLGQTHQCLGNVIEAYKMFKYRTTKQGFYEEVYNAHINMGGLVSHHLPLFQQTLEFKHYTWNNALEHYLEAYSIIPRAEPLFYIAEHYRHVNAFGISYIFIRTACELEYPNNILHVDKEIYEYRRYHLLGIVAFYVGKLDEGKTACLKAIEARDAEIDRTNLLYYE